MHIGDGGSGTGQLHPTGNAHTTTIFLPRLPTFRHLPRTTSRAGIRRVIAAAAAVTAAAVASVRFVLLTSGTRRRHGAGERREHTRTRNVFARVYGSLYDEPVFPLVYARARVCMCVLLQCQRRRLLCSTGTHAHTQMSDTRVQSHTQYIHTHARK